MCEISCTITTRIQDKFGHLLFTFSHSCFLFLPVWLTSLKIYSLRTHFRFLMFQAKCQKELHTYFSDSTSHFPFPTISLSHSYPKFTLPLLLFPILLSSQIQKNPIFSPKSDQNPGKKKNKIMKLKEGNPENQK